MSRFFAEKLSNLEPYVPGEQPKNLEKLIKLNTNESPFPPSPRVVDAINEKEVMNLNLYSDPESYNLRKAIADYCVMEPENIFVSNGSDETLALCFHGFCEKGAVFPDITYGFYKVFADMFNVPAEIVPLRSDFTIASEDYRDKQGTVIIANPNAPTGMMAPLSVIEAIIQQDSNRLVIIDEAYVDFGGKSAISLLGKYDNLLIVRTFSKSRSLAGARIGFAIGNPDIINDLNSLKDSLNPYNVNRLSALAGIAGMEDTVYFDACRENIIKTRQATAKALKELGFTVLDSKANFLFAAPSGFLDGITYYRSLKEKNILVRHFDKPRIRNFVRITIGTEEQMITLINSTKEILEEVLS